MCMNKRPSINLWSFKATVTLCNFTRFPQHCNPRTCEQAMICPSTRHPGCKKRCRGRITLLLLALFSLAFLCSHWTSRKHTALVCSFALTGSEAQEDKSLTCAHPTAHISKAGTYNAPFFCLLWCLMHQKRARGKWGLHTHTPVSEHIYMYSFHELPVFQTDAIQIYSWVLQEPDGKPRNWP